MKFPHCAEITCKNFSKLDFSRELKKISTKVGNTATHKVVYTTRMNAEKPPSESGKQARAAVDDEQEKKEAIIYVTFENNLVQVIEDSYNYSFLSIFSEIGGAVGIMVGMSCMTIIEYLLMLHKKSYNLQMGDS